MKFYPVIIHKDTKSAFGVIVPDLPGCFSAGATLDEAIRNVQEAVEVHMFGEEIAPLSRHSLIVGRRTPIIVMPTQLRLHQWICRS